MNHFHFHSQFKSGNFPSSLGNETDRLIHWCHGSPGAVHLFLEAALAFPNHRHAYMKIAEDCAQVIWERGLLKKGYGLCHGVSGNGYAFVHLFQATGNPKYLYYAAKFAEFCFDHGQHGCNTPDRPYSLFEGLAGTIYFLSDILNPAASKFPAFYTWISTGTREPCVKTINWSKWAVTQPEHPSNPQPTWLWLRYLQIRWIENCKYLLFRGYIAILTWPEQSKNYQTRPGSQNVGPKPISNTKLKFR